MVNGADFFNWHIECVQPPDHGTQGEGIMVFQIPDKCGSPVNCVQGFEHLCVPAGNGSIVTLNPVEQVSDYPWINTGHIACGYKNYLSARSKGSRMESADGSCSRTYVSYAPDTRNRSETFALLRVPGYKDDFVYNLRKRFDQPLDKGLSLVREEIFLLPVCASRLSTNKDNC